MISIEIVNKRFTAAEKIRKILQGKFPGLPIVNDLYINVEDVARAVLKVLDKSNENIQRYWLAKSKRINF